MTPHWTPSLLSPRWAPGWEDCRRHGPTLPMPPHDFPNAIPPGEGGEGICFLPLACPEWGGTWVTFIFELPSRLKMRKVAVILV